MRNLLSLSFLGIFCVWFSACGQIEKDNAVSTKLRDAWIELLSGDSKAYLGLIDANLLDYYRDNSLSISALIPDCDVFGGLDSRPMVEVNRLTEFTFYDFICYVLISTDYPHSEIKVYELSATTNSRKCYGKSYVIEKGRVGKPTVVFPKADTYGFSLLDLYTYQVYSRLRSRHLVGSISYDPTEIKMDSKAEAISYLRKQKEVIDELDSFESETIDLLIKFLGSAQGHR